MAVAMVYIVFVTSAPEDSRFVSKSELALIKQVDMKDGDFEESVSIKLRPPVPWIQIFTSKAILTAMFTRFTVAFPYQVLQSKLPVYLASILHVPMTKVGDCCNYQLLIVKTP